MSELGAVFAFASNNGFFFEYRGYRKWRNIPRPLEEIFTQNDSASLRTLSLCIGPGEDSYILFYENAAGKREINYHNLPRDLETWILGESMFQASYFAANTMQLHSLNVSLGDKGGFFATKTFKTPSVPTLCGFCRWRTEGDPDLDEAIQTFVGFNNCLAATQLHDPNKLKVVFGAGNEVILYHQDLAGEMWSYVRFNDRLVSTLWKTFRFGPGSADRINHYVVLDPFCSENYFLLRPDGSADWKVNRSFADEVNEIASIILRDQSVSGSTSPQSPQSSNAYQSARGYETQARASHYETEARR